MQNGAGGFVEEAAVVVVNERTHGGMIGAEKRPGGQARGYAKFSIPRMGEYPAANRETLLARYGHPGRCSICCRGERWVGQNSCLRSSEGRIFGHFAVEGVAIGVIAAKNDRSARAKAVFLATMTLAWRLCRSLTAKNSRSAEQRRCFWPLSLRGGLPGRRVPRSCACVRLRGHLLGFASLAGSSALLHGVDAGGHGRVAGDVHRGAHHVQDAVHAGHQCHALHR